MTKMKFKVGDEVVIFTYRGSGVRECTGVVIDQPRPGYLCFGVNVDGRRGIFGPDRTELASLVDSPLWKALS